MTNLEKLYRARELIESRTGGRQQLALGWDGMAGGKDRGSLHGRRLFCTDKKYADRDV